MSDPDQIAQDLRDYLEKEPNLRREDRFLYLKTIFDKHFFLSRLEHTITRIDFLNIISAASSFYAKQKMPMYISRKQMDNIETTHVAMIESFISYLNRMNLLKKEVKFEYLE